MTFEEVAKRLSDLQMVEANNNSKLEYVRKDYISGWLIIFFYKNSQKPMTLRFVKINQTHLYGTPYEGTQKNVRIRLPDISDIKKAQIVKIGHL